MAINRTRFIPPEEIRRVTTGSQESLIAQLQLALEADHTRFFKSGSAARVLGTFDHHIVAVNEDLEVMKIDFERSDKGLELIKAEEIQVEQISPECLERVIRERALKVVDAFMVGSLSEGRERLAALIPLVKRPLQTESTVVAAVRAALHSDRPWRNLYQERAEQFRAYLGVDHQRARSEVPSALRWLHSGGRAAPLPRPGSGGRRVLGRTVREAAESINSALQSVKGVQDRLDPKDLGALTALDSFAQDLLADLRGIEQVANESTSNQPGVQGLAEIYDMLAKRCPPSAPPRASSPT